MEPIGFAVGVVGLAGLFSVCLDVIDKVDSYKDFGVESRSIIAQFEADKYLFTKWAQDVGIYKDKLNNNYHSQLDNPETNMIVQQILSSIQEIFSKIKNTVSELQAVAEAGSTSFPDSILFLSARKKSLRSNAEFITQVQQFGSLVQRLYNLVPPDGLTGPGEAHKGTIGNNLSSRNGMHTSKSAVE